jgi:hypothetical protein
LLFKIVYEELLRRSPRRKLLSEYACHLVKYHPHLKNDVLFKLQSLNSKWKLFEFSILTKCYCNERILKGKIKIK